MQTTIIALAVVIIVIAVGGIILLTSHQKASTPPANTSGTYNSTQASGGTEYYNGTGPYYYSGKGYYVVNALNSSGDTGTLVCLAHNLKCVGYTDYDNLVCKLVHPSAAATEGLNGTRNGFYCNGIPQGGICALQTNTCNVCPQCNINANCDTHIGDQYRELFVECVKNASS